MIQKTDNLGKFRHEYKLAINMSDYFELCVRLAAVMKRDINAGHDGRYRVRSIYFDNIYNKVLNEKIDGLDNRIKYRIRLYNNDTSVIRLEKKSRIRGLISKKSAVISSTECDSILRGDIGFLKDRDDGLSGELYAGMRSQMLKPVTVVDYLREAYVYEPGNVWCGYFRNRSGLPLLIKAGLLMRRRSLIRSA